MNRYFITGTDTDAGKTLASCALLHRAQAQGLRGYGLKPVASGACWQDGQLRNSDALQLQAASNVHLPYAHTNPVVLEPAIAPHIAAAQAGQSLCATTLAQQIEATCQQYPADVVVIEGAGGWLVPLDTRGAYLRDIAQHLALDVVLVVGLKLGCINHALLTAQAIGPSRLVGWIGSATQAAMPVQAENIATLQALLPAPCLGIIPHLPGITGAQASQFVRLPNL